MAEFCLDCWNKLNKANYTERDFILSKELDFCEECEKWRHVIVTVRRNKYIYDLMKIIKESK